MFVSVMFGNSRYVSRFAIIILLLTLFIGTASAETWYVDDSGGADFTSIQNGVNTATAGDIIIVKDGTYNENVDVDKRLTIRSENGADKTIVQAADTNDHVFNLISDYVNVSGFKVTGATGRRPTWASSRRSRSAGLSARPACGS